MRPLPFHAGRVQLTDNNRTSAADIDVLSHSYLMILKGQSHYINGGAQTSAGARRRGRRSERRLATNAALGRESLGRDA